MRGNQTSLSPEPWHCCWVQVDRINRSVAARIAGAFTQWKQLDTKRQGLIKQELKRIVEVEGVSENLYEVASKSL